MAILRKKELESKTFLLFHLLKNVSLFNIDKEMLVRTTLEHDENCCRKDYSVCFCSKKFIASRSDIFSAHVLLGSLFETNQYTMLEQFDSDIFTHDICLLTDVVSDSDEFYKAAYNRLSFDKQTLIDELIHMTQFMYKDTDAQQNKIKCEVLFQNRDINADRPFECGFYSTVFDKNKKTLAIKSDLDFTVSNDFGDNYTYLTLNEDEINQLPAEIKAFLTDDATILNLRLQALVVGDLGIKHLSQDILKFHEKYLSDSYSRYAEHAEIEFYDLGNTLEHNPHFVNEFHFYLLDKFDNDVEDYEEHEDYQFDNSGNYIITKNIVN